VTRWRLGLAAVLALALGLRLWGIRHGLPYSYNSDENGHFVPRAIRFFSGDYNPHYFKNPPAYTYLVHAALAAWFVGRDAVAEFARDPGEVFTVARVVTALLGTATVGLVYLLGARLFDRRVGLVAGAIMAVAFLPVFYSHLALNDVPATAPLALSLVGSAGILQHGRQRDYALAGAAFGAAAATKYTAGIVLVPLLAAAGLQFATISVRRAMTGLALAGCSALLAFLVLNPFSLLDFHAFHDQLINQSRINRPKVGMTEHNALRFYLWTLTWGLGWAPALAALAGAVLVLRENLRAAALLLAPVALFLVFMVGQERFFGRWLLPIFPIACVLAGYAAVRAIDLAQRYGRRAAIFVAGLATAGLLAQGLVYTIHDDLVLSRSDTRDATRAWLVANVPAGSSIVLEPFVPTRNWIRDLDTGRKRWRRDQTDLQVEDYTRRLRPPLIDEYLRNGSCWVISGSTVSGRAFADPDEVPQAVAYYRALDLRGRVAFHATPYGSDPVPFNFDWSFDYYPLAFDRPGPRGNCLQAPRPRVRLRLGLQSKP
jgi:hypothetical protein